MQNCYFSCKVLDFILNFSLKELACANVKEQAIVKSAQKKSQVFQRKYRKTWHHQGRFFAMPSLALEQIAAVGLDL